jgi:cytidine deaminase
MTHQDLINKAASVIRPRQHRGGLIGDVGCALVAESGKVYLGVCADIGSNVFCAEQNAIGSMITDGESRVRTIVATWKDEGGATYVIAPCGNCRQFMLDIDESNLDSAVILDAGRVVKLRDLLPAHDSWRRQ